MRRGYAAERGGQDRGPEEKRCQNQGGEGKRPARRRNREETPDPDLLPINRSHIGCAGVKRMRRQGFSEERIKTAIKDWLLKPIPREDRLNGYRAYLRLTNRPERRLINFLTPEQLEKAKSIFRKMCNDHREDLSEHPKRLGVYWACAVSRVRASVSYRYELNWRNQIKGTYNKMLFPKPMVQNPVVKLERQNQRANQSLHRLLDACENG